MAVCRAAGISRRKREKQGERCNANPACAAGVLQELYHQPFTQPGFSSSGESTRIWSFLPAGGAMQAASTRSRARVRIQMCSHGTDCY